MSVYDKYLEPEDLVGYYGLGDGWIFRAQPKGANDAKLREQIVSSVEKAGDPHVYSSIETCIGCLARQVDETVAHSLFHVFAGESLTGFLTCTCACACTCACTCACSLTFGCNPQLESTPKLLTPSDYYFLLPTPYSIYSLLYLLTTLSTHYSIYSLLYLPTTHYSPLATHYSLLTTHCSLLTTY